MQKNFDLNSNLDEYLNKSSALNAEFNGKEIKDDMSSDNYTKYELKLIPDDFYSFGSGFGDDDVDMTPVYEETIEFVV